MTLSELEHLILNELVALRYNTEPEGREYGENDARELGVPILQLRDALTSLEVDGFITSHPVRLRLENHGRVNVVVQGGRVYTATIKGVKRAGD
jgi:hypothetical protein